MLRSKVQVLVGPQIYHGLIMNIVPYENTNFSDEEVYFDEVTINYYQNADCTEDTDDSQKLQVSCRNNGVGRFINIKTENWSLDDPYDFVKIIQDFCKRVNIELDSIEQNKQD